MSEHESAGIASCAAAIAAAWGLGALILALIGLADRLLGAG
jgi:hypothetical protein